MNGRTDRARLRLALFIGAAIILLGLIPAGAVAAPPLNVSSVSALDATHVKVSFSRTVDTSATNPARYSVSPSLSVTAAVLTDNKRTVTLTTATQVNATPYTLTVSGVTGMKGNQQDKFLGTNLPPNDGASFFEDDFNRPAGLLLGDLPVAGRWTNLIVTGVNTVALRDAPPTTPSVPWAGTGSLYTVDDPYDPDNDNASLQAKIMGNDFFYSAYLCLPAQSWPAGTEVGLLRLNTAINTAHARVFAVTESPSAYTLQVNWKNPAGGYNAVSSTAATGVSFGKWHWLQLHVRNGVAGAGEVQVFLDGKLAFQDGTTGVDPVKMIYAEAGIMHMTPGTTATTYTDQVRVGPSFTLPSLQTDTTAPAGVALTTSATEIHDPATFTVTGTDAVGVQRAEFLLDGQVVASDDFAADYRLADGTYTGTYETSFQATGVADGAHQLTARLYDTSGNVTTTGPITVTTDSSGPAIVSPAASPNPFTPNGDGSQDKTSITFTTTQTASYSVRILNGATLVKTLKSVTDAAAGAQSATWDGTYYDATTQSNLPTPDGTYTARITATDSYGRVTVVDLPVTLDRTLKSYTVNRTAISPVAASTSYRTVTGTYYLLADADVTVAVEGPAGLVRTVQVATAETGNADTPVQYKFTWDGKDDLGAIVPDGPYTVRVTAANAVGTVSIARTVTVDTTAPSVTIDSVTPFPTWAPAVDGPLAFTFSVSEGGPAQVKFTLSGVTQRTIAMTAADAGQYAGTWDGTMNDLTTPAPAGAYRVKVYFTDKAGNTATLYPVQSDLLTLTR